MRKSSGFTPGPWMTKGIAPPALSLRQSVRLTTTQVRRAESFRSGKSDNNKHQTLFLQSEEDALSSAWHRGIRRDCGREVVPRLQIGGFLQQCSRLRPTDHDGAANDCDAEAESG